VNFIHFGKWLNSIGLGSGWYALMVFWSFRNFRLFIIWKFIELCGECWGRFRLVTVWKFKNGGFIFWELIGVYWGGRCLGLGH